MAAILPVRISVREITMIFCSILGRTNGIAIITGIIEHTSMIENSLDPTRIVTSTKPYQIATIRETDSLILSRLAAKYAPIDTGKRKVVTATVIAPATGLPKPMANEPATPSVTSSNAIVTKAMGENCLAVSLIDGACTFISLNLLLKC